MDANRLSVTYSGHLCWGTGLNIWKIEADKDVVWPSAKQLNKTFALFDEAGFEGLQIVEQNSRGIRIAIPQRTGRATRSAFVAVIASLIPQS